MYSQTWTDLVSGQERARKDLAENSAPQHGDTDDDFAPSNAVVIEADLASDAELHFARYVAEGNTTCPPARTGRGRKVAITAAAAAGISGLATLGAMAPSDAETPTTLCVDEGDGDGWGVNLETNHGCLIPGTNPAELCRDDGDGDRRGFNPAFNEGCELPELSSSVAKEMPLSPQKSNEDSTPSSLAVDLDVANRATDQCTDEGGELPAWGVNPLTNEGCWIDGVDVLDCGEVSYGIFECPDGERYDQVRGLGRLSEVDPITGDAISQTSPQGEFEGPQSVAIPNNDSATQGGIHVPLFDSAGNENCIQTNSFNTCDLEPSKGPSFIFIASDDIAQFEDPNDSSIIRDGVTVPLLNEDGNEYCLPHLTRNLNECDLMLKADSFLERYIDGEFSQVSID